jgi:hypothetical protein
MIDAYENYRRMPGRPQSDPNKFKNAKTGPTKIQISTKTDRILENPGEL